MTAPCLTPLFGRPALAQGILTVGSHGREVLRAVAGEREIYTEMLSLPLMKQRSGSLELLLARGPIGHDAIHERMEPWPVVRLEKMAEFVNDHVF